MKVERHGAETAITLAPAELKLLRRALERASYVDTPVEEQEAIMNFCVKALEQLG
jgi:hypothetical protein